jgi:hypothetical protein
MDMGMGRDASGRKHTQKRVVDPFKFREGPGPI